MFPTYPKSAILLSFIVFLMSYPVTASDAHEVYVCSTFEGVKALSVQNTQDVRLPRTFNLGGGVCHVVPVGTIVEQVSGGEFPCIQSNQWAGCRYIQSRALNGSENSGFQPVPRERRKFKKVGGTAF